MDEKTLKVLEFPKVLDRLAERAAFSGSARLARELRPSDDLHEVRRRLAETSEARRLLMSRPNTTIGAARDIRSQIEAAQRSMVLPIPEILDVKATLISARNLARAFEKTAGDFPYLTEIAAQIPPPLGLIDAISQVINENGDIPDNASPELARIRRDMRIVHDRLLSKMQRMLSDPQISPYLQDNLITQRDGRYVIPLRSDFKGRVRAVIHDQSGSGQTLFVEPLTVVEQNNEHRQLQLDERDEERRLLAGLSALIADRADELEVMVETIAWLDLIFSRAKYAEDLDAQEPSIIRLKGSRSKESESSVIRLLQARHPLLDPETVVPIDAVLPPKHHGLVITGPNTGGKTVTLKTVGLLVIMAQAGLHIPVSTGSQLSLFENVYADIGDEQSIEQSLSTFSGHITNIIRILDQAHEGMLVLFDELGSGTDPQEGAALASALLTHLLDRKITTFIATHYPELKAYAHARKDVVNASVEFDIETLRPTFHLIIGLPGASNALTIARRLGLSSEIVELARGGVSADELQAEDLLAEIHQQRDLIRQTRAEAEAAKSEVEGLRGELEARLSAIDDERRDVLEVARQEGEDRLAQLDQQMRRLRRQLAAARRPLDDIEEAAEILDELEDEVAVPVETLDLAAEEQLLGDPEDLVPGDKVIVRSLGSEGVITSMDNDDVEVQIGILRIRAGFDELRPVGSPVSAPKVSQSRKRRAPEPAQAALPVVHVPAAPSMELDLRGMRVEEALERLADYLDAGYLTGMPFVRIIHGKGTGRLRKAVQGALKDSGEIASFEPGQEGEGGHGVTVVKFRSG
jgi:DNA mismatch repair protein MutS2